MPTDKLNLDYLPGHLELLLQSEDYDAVEKLLQSFRPEDMADVLLKLSREHIRDILERIEVELASELIECIDDVYWNELLSPLSQERLLAILKNLASDDAADLLEELEEEVRNELLVLSAKQPDLASVRALLLYPEETAGAIMNPDIVLIPQYLDVDHALNTIRQNIDLFQDISALFITNLKGQLTGTLDLAALISAPPKTRLRDIMDKDFIAVDVLMDEDDVVDVVRKYEMTTVPVVDAQGMLMGLITIDDIIDVIEEQADEEAYKMAAMPEPDAQDSAFRSALVRIPWLLICLGGSLSAGRGDCVGGVHAGDYGYGRQYGRANSHPGDSKYDRRAFAAQLFMEAGSAGVSHRLFYWCDLWLVGRDHGLVGLSCQSADGAGDWLFTVFKYFIFDLLGHQYSLCLSAHVHRSGGGLRSFCHYH